VAGSARRFGAGAVRASGAGLGILDGSTWEASRDVERTALTFRRIRRATRLARSFIATST